MSYGLTAFAIAETNLYAYFEASAEEITRLNQVALADESAVWSDEEDEEESVSAFLYEFKNAVKRVKELDNNAFMPCPTEGLVLVDNALIELGAPDLQITGWNAAGVEAGLLSYNFPVQLPRPTDFPLCGWWSSELILATHEKLKNIDRAQDNDFVANAVSSIKYWLADVAALTESLTNTNGKPTPICIVGFYH
jgi:hypothetical protein